MPETDIDAQNESYYRANPYKSALPIVKLTQANGDDGLFMVVRKTEQRPGFDMNWLIIPAQPISELDAQSQERIKTSPHVKTTIAVKMQTRLTPNFFHKNISPEYMRLDFKDAEIFDASQAVTNGIDISPVHYAQPKEMPRIIGFMNDIMCERPFFRIPAIDRFKNLATFKNEEPSVYNPVWDRIFRRRATPHMDAADIIDRMETARKRVQKVMNEYRISARDASDHILSQLAPVIHDDGDIILSQNLEKLDYTPTTDVKPHISLFKISKTGEITLGLLHILSSAGYHSLESVAERHDNHPRKMVEELCEVIDAMYLQRKKNPEFLEEVKAETKQALKDLLKRYHAKEITLDSSAPRIPAKQNISLESAFDLRLISEDEYLKLTNFEYEPGKGFTTLRDAHEHLQNMIKEQPSQGLSGIWATHLKSIASLFEVTERALSNLNKTLDSEESPAAHLANTQDVSP